MQVLVRMWMVKAFGGGGWAMVGRIPRRRRGEEK